MIRMLLLLLACLPLAVIAPSNAPEARAYPPNGRVTVPEPPLAMQSLAESLAAAPSVETIASLGETPAEPIAKKTLEPPTVKIKGPDRFEEHTLGRFHIELGGGKTRELDVVFDPDLGAENLHRDPADAIDFIVCAQPGVYTVRAQAIGEEIGHPKTEFRFVIVKKPTAVAMDSGKSADPSAPIRKKVAEIRTRNRETESLAVAKAGRKTRAKLAGGKMTPEEIADDWSQEAYLVLGSAASPAWNATNGGESFFAFVANMLRDNQLDHALTEAEVVDAVVAVLESQ